jgi:hypothetical protein
MPFDRITMRFAPPGKSLSRSGLPPEGEETGVEHCRHDSPTIGQEILADRKNIRGISKVRRRRRRWRGRRGCRGHAVPLDR